MIRYRFDTLGQLTQHLHVVDNVALLFVPDPRKGARLSGRTLLELSARESGHHTVVRGDVVARAEGGMTGSWLRLADLRLAKRLRETGTFAARRDGRISADQVVRLRGEGGEQLVLQLLDISKGGMRVRGAAGLRPGQRCSVRLLGAPASSADLGLARVMRIDSLEVGLRFDETGNPQVARYIDQLKKDWSQAIEVDHLPGCCAGRGPIEPSLPQVRRAAMR